MSQLFTGSICYTDLREALKNSHSSGVKSKNGKIYANVSIWLNDEPDQYGNDLSIHLNSTKEKKEEENKIYIGNAKEFKNQELSKTDEKSFASDDDMPF